MAEVPVTINGVAYPKNKKDAPFGVVIVGYAHISGLKPDNELPPGEAPPKPPLGIWGPTDPRPTPPIHLPPPMPDAPPDPPTEGKPPPADGGWGWSPEYGWGYFPGPGQPSPKGR